MLDKKFNIGDEVVVEWMLGGKRYKISSGPFISGATGYEKYMVKDDSGYEQSAPTYLISKLN